MDAKSKPISVAGAATLLLAIAAAITMACACGVSDCQYSLHAKGRRIALWGPMYTNCDDEMNLVYGIHNVPKDPAELLKWLRYESTSSRYIATYAQKLVAYAETTKDDACEGISVQEFVNLVWNCNSEALKPFANFVNHYAFGFYGRCARKTLNDLKEFGGKFQPLKEFFKAGLGLEGESLNDSQMYRHVEGVDLSEYEFNVAAMINAADELGRPKTKRTLSILLEVLEPSKRRS